MYMNATAVGTVAYRYSQEENGQAEACAVTLAFPCVDGCYLPKQENDFVQTVVEELEAFIQRDQQRSILLFPPLPSRLRYLTHRTAENHPCLSTFSVGRTGWSRRVVVCFSHLRLALEDGSDAEGGVCERPRVRGGGMESVEVERTSESRQARSRSHRRPDKAIYIPRAMRERAPPPTQALPTRPAPTQPTPPSTALPTTPTPTQLTPPSTALPTTPTPTQPTPPSTALPTRPTPTQLTPPSTALPTTPTPTQPTPPSTALPTRPTPTQPTPPSTALPTTPTPTQPTPPSTALPTTPTPTQPTPPPAALPSQLATPTQPTPPPAALSSQLATPTTVSPTQLGPAHPSLGVSEESCPAPLANHQPASDALLGDPEDSPIPAHSDLGPWEQTMSYFVAMTLDDQSDNAGGSFGSAQPEAQLQTEGAKDSGDYLQEISGQLTEADFTIENVHSDYSGYETLWISPGEFAHVIEIYDFPAAFKTDDLLDAFTQFSEGGLKIKWVDNTHALGVFSSESAALQALCMQHPLVKVRSLYEASKKSKGKALRRAEFLQPVKERPRTDTAVARRMVTRALGLPKPVLRGKRC